MHIAAAGSGVVALLGMIVVAAWLPGRRVARHARGTIPEQRQAVRVAETAGSQQE
jgi:hypothetical protein